MKALNIGRGSLWYRLCLQLASLYNPVDKRVKERVKKMLLLGVTQRSEMRPAPECLRIREFSRCF